VPRKTSWPPKLKNHRGRARLRWTRGQKEYDFICGPWDEEKDEPSLEAQKQRLRILEEVEAGRDPKLAFVSRRLTPTVAELALAYGKHCQANYNEKQMQRVRTALRLAVAALGRVTTADVNSRSLERVRDAALAHRYCARCRRDEQGCRAHAEAQAMAMAESPRTPSGEVRRIQCAGGFVPRPLTRHYVNLLVGVVRRMFRWGLKEGMVPPDVVTSLGAVEDLKPGARCPAPDRPAVRPVADGVVEATLPHLPPVVADMVRVQRLSGARPGEVCVMRGCDVERPGLLADNGAAVWLYRLGAHKGQWRGKGRVVKLGPRAQEVIRQYLEGRPPEAYLFSPRETVELLRAARRARAKKMPAATRKKAGPKCAPGDRYTTHSYGRAVREACRKAGLPHWHPHQLRHSAATEAYTREGRDTSMAFLGHESASANAGYSEADQRGANYAARHG
jgi:integrase